MPIRLTCSCGKALEAPESAAGKQVRCRSCGAVTQVPGPGGQAAMPGIPPAVAPVPGYPAAAYPAPPPYPIGIDDFEFRGPAHKEAISSIRAGDTLARFMDAGAWVFFILAGAGLVGGMIGLAAASGNMSGRESFAYLLGVVIGAAITALPGVYLRACASLLRSGVRLFAKGMTSICRQEK